MVVAKVDRGPIIRHSSSSSRRTRREGQDPPGAKHDLPTSRSLHGSHSDTVLTDKITRSTPPKRSSSQLSLSSSSRALHRRESSLSSRIPNLSRLPSDDSRRFSSETLGSRSTSSSSLFTTERPTSAGAYYVHRILPSGKELMTVVIPEGCRPGDRFNLSFGTSRRVCVTCPPDCDPGTEVDILIDREYEYHYRLLKPAALTVSPAALQYLPRNPNKPFIGGAFPMRPDIEKINRKAMKGGVSTQTHVIVIPPDAEPGKPFVYKVAGVRFKSLCPANALPGERIRIVPQSPVPSRRQKRQPIAIQIPKGVRPNGAFTFHVGSTSTPITLRCPPGKKEGDTIQAMLPIEKFADIIKLEYPGQKSGWVRSLRSEDLQFQWVRLSDDSSVVDEKEGFDFFKSAYVRKIQLLEGNDPRLPTGSIELVPAEQAKVDSHLKDSDGTSLFSCSDIAVLQGRPLKEKHQWFLETCKKLHGNIDDGDYVKIVVNRKRLVQDSFRAVLSMGRKDLHRKWNIEFLGELGKDEGGPTREWFELVSSKVTSPDVGLFVYSQNNQAAVEVNPLSSILCEDDHLLYFRFIGRLIGKALIDGQLVKVHFTQLIYKFMLGWPINSRDIPDDQLYRSWSYLARAHQIPFGLNFTIAQEMLGRVVETDLVEGGADVPVTLENLDSFLSHCISYHLMEKNVPQLTELLLGFFDVVPEAALTVFDANELELILCGLPEVSVEDWKKSTLYTGLFQNSGEENETVRWFWEVVDEFDQEKRARLLQFATGTSGVPLDGFQRLRGGDGAVKLFTIEGVDPAIGLLYPRAHTCFNKMDLPIYESKEDLKGYLIGALTTSYVGFDLE